MAVKKSASRKSAAKKSSAKKKTVKKTVKKAAAKKVVKKAAKKSTTKKVVKKAAAKKVVKKAAAKRSSASMTVPAVPLRGTRTAPKVNVSSTPTLTSTAKTTQSVKPATPKKNSSNQVFVVLTLAIVVLGLIVWSKSSSTSETATPSASQSAMAQPSASESAAPEASASAESTEPAEVNNAVSSNPAPERFIGNFRNNGDTLLLTWRAPAGAEGITGYNVEVRPATGEWASVDVVGADVFKYELQKTSGDSWSQFRVSAVYSDGQAAAKIFGFAGQWSK